MTKDNSAQPPFYIHPPIASTPQPGRSLELRLSLAAHVGDLTKHLDKNSPDPQETKTYVDSIHAVLVKGMPPDEMAMISTALGGA